MKNHYKSKCIAKNNRLKDYKKNFLRRFYKHQLSQNKFHMKGWVSVNFKKYFREQIAKTML